MPEGGIYVLEVQNTLKYKVLKVKTIETVIVKRDIQDDIIKSSHLIAEAFRINKNPQRILISLSLH